MAQELKYASIDTMSPEDVQAMFELICEKIFGKKPTDVKKEILNIKGSAKEIEKYKITPHDLINLIVAYDIKFELKINYLEGKKEDQVAPEKPVITKTANELQNQKSDIVDPELQKTANSASNIAGENDQQQDNKKVGETPTPPNFLQD